MTNFERDVREFIVENFLFGEADADLSSEESLLEKGIIDSTGVLELVMFLEKKYGIEIAENELVPANLDSINNVVHFIGRKVGVSA